MSTDVIRDSFVARFGEDQAAAVEAAADRHVGNDDAHENDDRGANPFQWSLLAAIGYECIGRYVESHGITADPDDIKAWALAEGDLANYSGDIPDYLALRAGTYSDWVNTDDDEEV